jgi:hypothetical protein
MGESEVEVLAKQQGVVRRDIGISQQAGESRHVVVREELRGLFSQEASGDEHIELLAPIEIEHGTDAVEHFTADPATSGFEPAESAAVDLRKLRGLLLSQTPFFAKSRQEASELFARTRRAPAVRR